MSIKDQLLSILERSREIELEFIASLSDVEKQEPGSYERWSAKDNLAHANYWEELRARQMLAFLDKEDFRPIPQFEQANLEIYEQFVPQDWDAITAFAEKTHTAMLEAIERMDEETLNGPSVESEGRKMWDAIVGVGYSHKITHYSQFYEDRDRKQEVGHLWKEWAELVSPLDSGPNWQGGVHYNAACSLALVGEVDAALAELKTGLELRPGLRGWSRLDSDLAALHEHPDFKALFAPAYWWEALEAGPQVEALADQWLRTFWMLRNALESFPQEEWTRGETLYQRPVSLALHILQSTDGYTALEPGEGSGDPITQVSWQERAVEKLPSQAEVLAYIDVVEERMAGMLVKTDLEAEEQLFPWTGKTVQSRVLYILRHAQHHLADLAMELQRRGFNPPDWQ